jgi:pimeloyl-ACP methyl ester carboxylesterase
MTIPCGLCTACCLSLVFLSPFGARETVAQETPGAARIDRIAVESGSGRFVVEGGGGYEEKRITVFYHKPESFDRESPVVMVIPGAGRNGDDYRDAWVSASEKYGVLILSPSYPEEFYPGFWSYNLAGMTRQVTIDVGLIIDTQPEEWNLDDVRDELESTVGGHEPVGHSAAAQRVYQLVLLARAGMLTDVEMRGDEVEADARPEAWIFNDFDRIFEAVKNELGLQIETYDLFGHSAGGQILHRLALFDPSGRIDRILAANSGWYTVPTFEQDFPYGLKGSGMTKERLAHAFGAHLVVFLGEEDDEGETRGSLRRTPDADRQGTHRLARGKHFFGQARDTAEALSVDLEWKLEIIPGVGHDYRHMSQAAAEYLYGGEESK